MSQSPSPARPASEARGYAIALIGTAIWSTTGVLIRALTERQMPPLVLAFWRDFLVAVAMITVLAVVRPRLLRVPREAWRFLVSYGLLLTMFNATWTISVALNGAAVSTVLVYSSPAITALAGYLLWREPLGPIKVIAVLLSLVGSVFVSGAYSAKLWALQPAGIVLGLVSGMMFAAYSLLGKEASRRGLNPWTTLTVTFSCAALFFLPLLSLPLGTVLPRLQGLGTIGDLLWLDGDGVGWVLLIVLAWGPTIGGYGLYTVSLNQLPASVANLIASLEPSMTAVLAYAFLGERLTPPQLIGSVLVIGGVLLLRAESVARRSRLPAH
jgi:DME family drug/metabolite transporter